MGSVMLLLNRAVNMSNYKGFTLIEVMVALVIMSVLLAIAAPNFKNWMDATKLKSSAESFASGLSVARSDAIRRNGITSISLSSNSSGNFDGSFIITDENKALIQENRLGSSNIITTFSKTGCQNKQTTTPIPYEIKFNSIGNIEEYSSYDLIFEINNNSVSPIQLHITPGGDSYLCNVNGTGQNSCSSKSVQRGGNC